MTTPSLLQCWKQAGAEYPNDPVGRACRYRQLLIEHGHLVLDEEPDEPT